MMASSPSCVLAAISSGRPSSAGRSRSSSRHSTGGGGASTLRLPAANALGAPSVCEAARQALVLRQHQREAAEQRARDAQVAPPAPERALGHAGIDERQRNAARRAFQDQVRPDLRLGEDGEVRPPVVEEARARTRARRAARTDGWRAGPGAAAASLAEVTVPVVSRNDSAGRALGQRRHQRQDGIGLADAGRVKPGEPARGPRRARAGRAARCAAPAPPCRAARAA